MNNRVLVLSVGFCMAVASGSFSSAIGAANAVIEPARETPVKVGMKVKVLHAGLQYPGVLVRIDGARYVVRDDSSLKEYGYAIERLQDANGVPFAELLGTPQFRAAAAQDRKQGNDFFLALWTTVSPSVWTSVDAKKAPDTGDAEKKRAEGPALLGWLRINADNTWKHRIFGRTMEGTWRESDDKNRPGIVLTKGDATGENDLYVQRRPKGELFLQRSVGGAGQVATIVPPGVPEPDKS